MAVDISISDGSTQYLQGSARDEFKVAVGKYATDLLREISRLEAIGRTAKGDPEVTSTMVCDADLLLRKGYVRPVKKRWLIVTQIVCAVTGFLTGLFSNMETLRTPFHMLLFVILLVAFIGTTILVILKD